MALVVPVLAGGDTGHDALWQPVRVNIKKGILCESIIVEIIASPGLMCGLCILGSSCCCCGVNGTASLTNCWQWLGWR